MNSKLILVLFAVLFINSLIEATTFPQENPNNVPTVRQGFQQANITIVQQIVNGDDAGQSVIQHMAQLIIGLKRGSTTQESTCSATVISRRWLLTAAHCFFPTGGFEISFPDTYAFVAEGSSTLRVSNTKIRPYWVKMYLIHKNYKPNNQDSRNDVALVYLDRSIVRSKFSRVILARQARFDPKPGTTVIAAGYGVIDNRFTPSTRLQEAPLDIESFDTCLTATPGVLRPFLEERKMMCAKSSTAALNGPTDTCFGDSGGPLFIPGTRGKLPTQFAITSFATTFFCAQPNTVAWYTRVSHFHRAIRQGRKKNYRFWNVFSA